MSLKADQLKNNPNKMKMVKRYASQILYMIDGEIKKAHDEDKAKVAVSVPVTISIPNMSNATAQCFIYYEILISLIDRGFEVSIYMSKDGSEASFLIKWQTDEELHEKNMRMMLIAKHSISNN